MENKVPITTPVLVIGFNRPDVIKETLRKLKESKPTKMYLACDNARKGKQGEAELVEEVRQVINQEIDWPCEKHYKYNEINRGCEITVSEAISWVLDENDFVVVLEDDIVAPYAFLKFAQDMYYKYKDCEQVFQVSGDNYTPVMFPNNADYCFSRFGHTWGWATWKRAWIHFDLYANDFQDTMTDLCKRKDLTTTNKKSLKGLCERLIKEEDTERTNPKHNWDYMWSYAKWKYNGISIVPRVQLTSNIGIVGLHARGKTKYHYMKYDESFEARNHPEHICINTDYDRYHYNHWLKQPSFAQRIWGKLCHLFR